MGLMMVDRFVLFWITVGILAALLIWNLPWRFQFNDDEVMMWLVSGAYTGKPESYAVFLHPLLSWFFSMLYQAAPGFLWYPIAWFALMCASFVYMVFLVNRAQGRTFLQAQVWMLFIFAFYTHFLFFLQFSIVSEFAIFAGLAGRYIDKDEPKKSMYWPNMLILFGFLVRPEVLLVFLGGIFTINLLVVRSATWFRATIWPLVILIFGYLVIHFWILNSGMTEFQRYNRLRSDVFDHPVLQLDRKEALGIDPELYYFSNGLMDFRRDNELLEKLPIWKAKLDAKRVDWFRPVTIVRHFWAYIVYQRFFVALMALFVSFALLTNGRKAIAVLMVLILGMIVLTPFYMLKIQIYSLVFLIFTLMMFCLSSLPGQQRTVFVFYVVILLVGIGYHFFSFFHGADSRMPISGLNARLERLKQERYNEIFLIVSGNRYSSLVMEHSGKFKVLGWPTLLEKYREDTIPSLRAYLVDSAIYVENLPYFERDQLVDFYDGLYFLVPKE